MKTNKFLIAAFGAVMIASCSKKQENSETLTRANDIHLQSMALHDKLEKDLTALKRLAASQKDSVLLTQADSLANLVALWEQALIEVPGFEGKHGHGQHHEHKAAPQMTDESMLDYQQNTKEAIQELGIEAKKLSKQK